MGDINTVNHLLGLHITGGNRNSFYQNIVEGFQNNYGGCGCTGGLKGGSYTRSLSSPKSPQKSLLKPSLYHYSSGKSKSRSSSYFPKSNISEISCSKSSKSSKMNGGFFKNLNCQCTEIPEKNVNLSSLSTGSPSVIEKQTSDPPIGNIQPIQLNNSSPTSSYAVTSQIVEKFNDLQQYGGVLQMSSKKQMPKEQYKNKLLDMHIEKLHQLAKNKGVEINYKKNGKQAVIKKNTLIKKLLDIKYS